ncbi:MAG: hypothetical protein O9324_21885 [Microcystis sp. LE19-84.1B]|jgi:hypothetical protein|nr:hypothetical protein [Microcystis sp. LE19-84.1B]
MKTQGFEARFSQNLAPVGARKATKPLPCLHFTFIQQNLPKPAHGFQHYGAICLPAPDYR